MVQGKDQDYNEIRACHCVGKQPGCECGGCRCTCVCPPDQIEKATKQWEAYQNNIRERNAAALKQLRDIYPPNCS